MKKLLMQFLFWLMKPVIYIAPARVKRMVYLSSLYGSLSKQNTIDDVMLHRLNAALHLSNGKYGSDSLILPFMLQSLVWGDIEVELEKHRAPLTNPTVCADTICEIAPKWIRYTNAKQDVENLVVHVLQAKV